MRVKVIGSILATMALSVAFCLPLGGGVVSYAISSSSDTDVGNSSSFATDVIYQIVIKIDGNGNVVWEGGSNHTITTGSTNGEITVDWQ